MNTQKGFAHTFLILGLIFLTGFAVSAAYLNNVVKRQQATTPKSMVDGGSATLMTTKPAAVTYKTYTSISDSGLTFDYPDTWSFEQPTKQSITRDGQKATILMLSSKKPAEVNGRPEIASDNMCVTFVEMQGSWPFRYQALTNTDTLADFTVGEGDVSLVESRTNLASGVNAAMQLLNRDPVSKHGVSYVALRNEYYVLATAQRSCFRDMQSEKQDITTDIEQARSILKSVRLAQ